MINCCCISSKKSPPKTSSIPQLESQEILENHENIEHLIILKIPRCNVHLMEEGEAIELTNGDFEIIRVSEGDISIATVIKIGEELQWPLTKDEPVLKLDALNYLFSLPMREGKSLSYGVTFSEMSGNISSLDSFLKENSLFTNKSRRGNYTISWKDFAPSVDDYNSVLAKVIAGGTGQIVKGIFICSNAYTNQVQKGGEAMLIHAVERKNFIDANDSSKKDNSRVKRKQSAINKSLKRVRKLSKMTEKMSKAMLDVVGVASGSVVAPVVRSQAGKRFMSMVPGEVLLASLDAVNKIMDAAEAAEKQAFSATSGAVTRVFTNRYGENAGEATEDVLVTAGQCANTAWNVFKTRKAINPASSVSSATVKNASKIKP